VVLDSGDGVSHVVPVYEGFALPHAITRTDVAGRDVTDQLQVGREGGRERRSGGGRKSIFDIISTHPFYSHLINLCNSQQLLLRRSGYNLQTSAEKEVVRQIKEEKCYVSFNPRKEEETPPHADAYRLPDGVTLMVGAERFRAPEILFRPELIGSEEKGTFEGGREGYKRREE